MYTNKYPWRYSVLHFWSRITIPHKEIFLNPLTMFYWAQSHVDKGLWLRSLSPCITASFYIFCIMHVWSLMDVPRPEERWIRETIPLLNYYFPQISIPHSRFSSFSTTLVYIPPGNGKRLRRGGVLCWAGHCGWINPGVPNGWDPAPLYVSNRS